MSHGLLRAYLTALIQQRAAEVLFARRGATVKLAFVGGPMDGDERVEAKKQPTHTFAFASAMLRGPNDRPLVAAYELQRLDYPSQTATYRFAGWNEAGVA